jgi:hypothetical protein
MGELVDSIIEHFKTRLKTPVYGVFAFWWGILHWEFLYTLLFVDQEKIFAKAGLLKNVYLQQTYFDYDDVFFWIRQAVLVGVAALMTYVFIAILPKRVLLPAFKSQKEHEFDKRSFKLKKDRELESVKQQLEEDRITTLEKTEEKIVKEKDLKKTEEEIWEADYKKFKRTAMYGSFQAVLNVIYDENGYVGGRITARLKSYIHAIGLVEYDQDASGERFLVTLKGKFFIRRYLEDRDLSDPLP